MLRLADERYLLFCFSQFIIPVHDLRNINAGEIWISSLCKCFISFFFFVSSVSAFYILLFFALWFDWWGKQWCVRELLYMKKRQANRINWTHTHTTTPTPHFWLYSIQINERVNWISFEIFSALSSSFGLSIFGLFTHTAIDRTKQTIYFKAFYLSLSLYYSPDFFG